MYRLTEKSVNKRFMSKNEEWVIFYLHRVWSGWFERLTRRQIFYLWGSPTAAASITSMLSRNWYFEKTKKHTCTSKKERKNREIKRQKEEIDTSKERKKEQLKKPQYGLRKINLHPTDLSRLVGHQSRQHEKMCAIISQQSTCRALSLENVALVSLPITMNSNGHVLRMVDCMRVKRMCQSSQRAWEITLSAVGSRPKILWTFAVQPFAPHSHPLYQVKMGRRRRGRGGVQMCVWTMKTRVSQVRGIPRGKCGKQQKRENIEESLDEEKLA